MRNMSLLAAFALLACGYVAPTGWARLAPFSPLTVDPAALAAAVVMPEGLEVQHGGATLLLGATRTDTGETREGVFVLRQTDDENGRRLFTLPSSEVTRYRTLQSEIAAWEVDEPDATDGVFAVNVTACLVGDGPAEDARVSVDIRTEAAGGFVPLVVAAPLERIVRLATGSGARCG